MVNLHNYEEWFLLYIDGELNEKEISLLHAFLLEHPELNSELEALQSTILPTDNIAGKWNFLKKSEETEIWKDHILSDLDGELDKEESASLQMELASNISLSKFSKELHLTKLPQEKITFPDKAILLHEENNKKVVPLWFRYAAVAVVLFLIMGISWKMSQPNLPKIIVTQNTVPKIEATKSNKNKDSVLTKTEVAKTSTHGKIETHKQAPSFDKAISQKENKDRAEEKHLDEVAIKKPIDVDQTITPQASNTHTQPQAIETINVALNNPVKNIEPNIGVVSKEENNTPRSGKRMILASSLEKEDRINVANTSINLSKSFGLFKKNKEKSASPEYKKIAVASFEVKVKTGQL